jgi:hypothetical protein
MEETVRTYTITAFPNPAQDRITFQLPNSERPLRIELIDMLGAARSVIAEGASITIDQLAAGPHTVRIRTADKVFTSRFIKQ